MNISKNREHSKRKVTYTYVCQECEHIEEVLRDEIEDNATCPNCNCDMDVMWFASSYEDYLLDQGLDKLDMGDVGDILK